MNILIFNYSHPDLPHISAKRMSYFARHLAGRGHKVVLVTRTLDAEVTPTKSGQSHADPQYHDWTKPYILAVAPKSSTYLELSRSARTPAFLRRGILLFLYLFKQGRSSMDWSDQVVAQFARLDEFFKPDITWGTFGTIDTLWLAKKAANYFTVPYVIDIKDSWRYFIPKFRKKLAAQFNDTAGITINSSFQEENSLPWFKKAANHQVIYSGLDNAVVQQLLTAQSYAPVTISACRIVIVGSIYSDERFLDLIRAIDLWARKAVLTSTQPVTLTYAGADAVRVRQLIKSIALSVDCIVHDFLPYHDLFNLYRQAHILSYIYSERTFHHKLIELLAFNKPILTYPGESQESITLASENKGELHVCTTSNELVFTLDNISSKRNQLRPLVNQAIIDKFQWESLSKEVEHYFSTIITFNL